jgi:hypothetical protein
MKDVTLSVRTAYVSRLSGAVSYLGSPVKIYGRRVPSAATFPYIYIPSQNSVDDSTKSTFSTNHNVDVEIVWRSATGMEQNIVDDLSNQVMQLIATKLVGNCPQPVGFINLGTKFERSTELTDYDGTYTYLRKIITFSNIIYEG